MQHLVLLSSDFRQLVSYEVCIMTESASMLQDDPFSRTALDWLISLMWAISPEEKIETNKQKKTEDKGMFTENPVHYQAPTCSANIFHTATLNMGCLSLGSFRYEQLITWWLQYQARHSCYFRHNCIGGTLDHLKWTNPLELVHQTSFQSSSRESEPNAKNSGDIGLFWST